jgi:hypothetical protein
MAGRFGSLRLATVPWSQDKEFIYGVHEGLPLLKRNTAPRHLLATGRQLKARRLRPGGKDPVAVLLTKHRASAKTNFSSLWQISECVPMLAMTPAKRASIAKACAGRRICRDCGEQAWRDLPLRFGRRCEGCRAELGLYDEAMHELLVGAPTLSAAEHAELDQALVDDREIAASSQVIPLPRRAGTTAAPARRSFHGQVIAA